MPAGVLIRSKAHGEFFTLGGDIQGAKHPIPDCHAKPAILTIMPGQGTVMDLVLGRTDENIVQNSEIQPDVGVPQVCDHIKDRQQELCAEEAVNCDLASAYIKKDAGYDTSAHIAKASGKKQVDRMHSVRGQRVEGFG